MDCATANLIAIAHRVQWLRFHICVETPGDNAFFGIWTRILALEEAQFIMRVKINRFQFWAPLQGDHFHADFAEFGRQDGPGCTCANDDDFGLDLRHGSALSCARLRLLHANDWLSCESFTVFHVVFGKERLRARKPDQFPASKILVSPIDWV